MKEPWPTGGCRAKNKQNLYIQMELYHYILIFSFALLPPLKSIARRVLNLHPLLICPYRSDLLDTLLFRQLHGWANSDKQLNINVFL